MLLLINFQKIIGRHKSQVIKKLICLSEQLTLMKEFAAWLAAISVKTVDPKFTKKSWFRIFATAF